MSHLQEDANSNTLPISIPRAVVESNKNKNILESSETVKASKPPKQRLKVWEHFEVYVDKEKGYIKGKCKYYQKEYVADSKKNETSALNYYVRTCKKISGNENRIQAQLSLQPVRDGFNTNNASSNDVVVEHLKRKLINWGSAIANGKYLHIRCIAQIINLIVQDGVKDLDPAIRWVREAVKYIKSSPAKLKKFKECADSLQVESNTEKYENAFEIFELEDLYFRVEVATNSKGFVDWDVVRRTISMLGLFYDTTVRVSSSLYVTSNTFWTEISDLLGAILEWTRSNDSNVNVMGTKMKAKFDKYWGNIDRMNKLIFFTVVLDPRDKFMVMKVAFRDIYGENEVTSRCGERKKEKLGFA
ncbi:zinc finger BED domain-containing protein RICESLEEPER 2-like [Canna indica]|uniref:Zinc finger BED domain-containing protein RICESLEEPER 2-like n=1 Tax=Canna indica TaxID=4628 RepID=A0AAQ3Q240_9LILI|nr:zinc finger BED domain-containing protein RICESLEEPER 2-like [Canna indica]